MIRSTKISLKEANIGKRSELKEFMTEYRNVVSYFVDVLWEMDKVPLLLPKDVTLSADTWLSARARQSAAKQASAVVRGTRKKQKQRLHVYNKLVENKLYKRARKLKKTIDTNPISKPDINHVNPELDSRFVTFDMNSQTSFDGWFTISSIGRKLKIVIPFKKTRNFNKWNEIAEMKTGIRLGNKRATVMFEMEPTAAEGKAVGIDIGIKNVLTVSDGQTDSPDIHGHTLQSIQQKISRCRKGSKGFKKTCNHRTNHINRMINSINLDGVGTVRVENIKDLRRGRKSSRLLSHWTYTEITGKIESTCEERGVRVEHVDPTYTSQRCSQCGWTRKRNRHGKEFRCSACGFTCDADLNASVNISLDLPRISRKKRLGRPNLKGFYWSSKVGSL